jgi:hypothetical protein
MPVGSPRAPHDAPSPGPSLWQRTLLRLPRLGGGGHKPPVRERLEKAFLRPVDEKGAASPGPPAAPSLAELEAARVPDDQERLIGLSLAPLAGLIALVLTAHQLSNNPPALSKNGRPNPLHVSAALAHEVELVLLGLAVVILVSSLARKRLYTGIATALYGLAVFNLHWWGFGIPFVLAGAWFMVRAYRAQQAYRLATSGGEQRPQPAKPANKRYTPPAASPRPPGRARRRDERHAG